MFRSAQSDLILAWSLRGTAIITGTLVLVIFGYLALETLPVLRNAGWTAFVRSASWHPTASLYNITPMIAGTLMVSCGALLVAVPVGFFTALFCRFYVPKVVAGGFRRMVELMAGIPSVVYGFWGLMVVVPAITAWKPPGASLLAGIIVLAMMILPTIVLMADTALGEVPRSFVRAAHGLGLDRLGVLRTAVLPAARSGLVTAVILAAGRAVGETMAVIMVCGNIVQVPSSVFEPVRTLTANIALEMAYAMGDHRSALFASGLVLILMVTLLVVAAEVVSRHARPAHD